MNQVAESFSSTNSPPQAEEQLTIQFLSKHPIKSARILESLEPQEAVALLSAFTPKLMSHVLQYTLPHATLSILQALQKQLVPKVICYMSPIAAISALRLGKRTWQASILAQLNSQECAAVLKAFSFKDDSAGRLANPCVPVLTKDRTVSDAIQLIQNHPPYDTYDFYILDDQHRLIGTLSIRDILTSDLDGVIETIMTSTSQTIPAHWLVDEILRSPYWLHDHSLPVVDEHGTFLGIIGYNMLLTMQSGQAVSAAGQLEKTQPSSASKVASNETREKASAASKTTTSHTHAPRKTDHVQEGQSA